MYNFSCNSKKLVPHKSALVPFISIPKFLIRYLIFLENGWPKRNVANVGI